MATFKINLIRDRVLPLKQRRTIALVLFFWFIICVFFAVYLCYNLKGNFFRLAVERKAITVTETRISKELWGANNILASAKNTKMELAKCIEKLNTVDYVLSKRINLIRLLMSFVGPLSQDAYIDNLNLDINTQTLNFNVVVPLYKETDAFNTGGLISAWKNDAFLKTYIENIRFSASRTRENNGKKEFISTFSCNFSKEVR